MTMASLAGFWEEKRLECIISSLTCIEYSSLTCIEYITSSLTCIEYIISSLTCIEYIIYSLTYIEYMYNFFTNLHSQVALKRFCYFCVILN